MMDLLAGVWEIAPIIGFLTVLTISFTLGVGIGKGALVLVDRRTARHALRGGEWR